MGYLGCPCDFETTAEVEIDCEEILEYVLRNKEWFIEHILNHGETEMITNRRDLAEHMDSVIDKYNQVRILRDSSIENKDKIEVRLYEELLEIRKKVGNI